ncbi:unnamed protein product [Brassica rapa]|uniref:Uncharacterized protein n=1 Tax=Brassica campestris TaxID=3711 RepID=A0A8D9GC11_BRACM|nr:unnamed protein product [Brassica rapa]
MCTDAPRPTMVFKVSRGQNGVHDVMNGHVSSEDERAARLQPRRV